MIKAPFPLFGLTYAAVEPIHVGEANALLVRWGHNLGPCNRPFRVEACALVRGSQPLAVAISASTVSATVAGHRRRDVVELARLCADPAHRWATRALLRLWRETVAPGYWRDRPVAAAVSYSQNSRHDGALYRFDGWTRVTDRAGSSGGGTWTTKRTDQHEAAGSKTLWIWRYAQ